jgi:hypothetical protein
LTELEIAETHWGHSRGRDRLRSQAGHMPILVPAVPPSYERGSARAAGGTLPAARTAARAAIPASSPNTVG